MTGIAQKAIPAHSRRAKKAATFEQKNTKAEEKIKSNKFSKA